MDLCLGSKFQGQEQTRKRSFRKMDIPDEYIAALLTEESAKLDKKYKEYGTSAFSKRGRINKTFAKNIIKQSLPRKKEAK